MKVSMCDSKCMWEILVPTIRPDGRFISTKFHKVWDTKVRELSNGLTILKPAKGQWVSPTGELYTERMIPVRILCKRDEIEKIIDFTLKYYNQIAVLAYKISDDYILKYRDDNSKK